MYVNYLLTMRNVTELNLQEFVFNFIVFQSSVTSWEIRFCHLHYACPFYSTIYIQYIHWACRIFLLSLSASTPTLQFGTTTTPSGDHPLPMHSLSLTPLLSLSLYRTELNSMKMNSNWGNERLAAVLGRRHWEDRGVLQLNRVYGPWKC